MKTIFVFSSLLVLTLTFSSCDKWGCKKDTDSYYYSDDYRQASGTVLDVEISEITELWSVFFKEENTWKYKLIVETGEKDEFGKNDMEYEIGRADFDENMNITFVPDSNPSASYKAYFENNKKNYKVELPSLENREINFVLKTGK